MNEPVQRPLEPDFPWYLRTSMAVIGGGLVTLLLVAASLRPNPEGSGTHRQLGLPECSFKLMFDGMPCPSCGMTTSWSHLMRGQIVQSIRANIGGFMLGITAAIMGPWLLVSGLIGRWWLGTPNEWIAVGVALMIFATTMINWFISI